MIPGMFTRLYDVGAGRDVPDGLWIKCEGCGEIMDDFDEPGFPRRCVACSPRAGLRCTAEPGARKKRRKRRRAVNQKEPRA